MKIGDLVELSAASRKLLWTEPFHNTIGIVTRVNDTDTPSPDYTIRWMNIRRYDECSHAFQRKTMWSYRAILSYAFARKELKFAKRSKK
jgi:hypothetical protein